MKFLPDMPVLFLLTLFYQKSGENSHFIFLGCFSQYEKEKRKAAKPQNRCMLC